MKGEEHRGRSLRILFMAHTEGKWRRRVADNQCCGSGFIESGSGYGSCSSILSESGSGSTVLMNNKFKKKPDEIFLYIFCLIKNCNLLVPRRPQRTSKLQEKLSALKREHPALQKMNFTNSFLFLPSWIRIRIQGPK